MATRSGRCRNRSSGLRAAAATRRRAIPASSACATARRRIRRTLASHCAASCSQVTVAISQKTVHASRSRAMARSIRAAIPDRFAIITTAGVSGIGTGTTTTSSRR